VVADRGDLAEAEGLYREALALRRDLLPPDHAELGATLTGLGELLVRKGAPPDLTEAEELLREALTIRRQALAEGHWLIAVTESVLGGCLARQGRIDEARAALSASLPAIAARRGEDDRRSQRVRRWLAKLEG
jgi:tetratricopeptide (TPR) repeat protein